MGVRYVTFPAAIGVALVSLALHPATALPPPPSQLAGASTVIPAEIRALELTDQDGHNFKLADALGRTLVLNFIFTGCGDICPTQTADLADIEHALPPELRSKVIFVSISIDPAHDIPGTLRQYGDARRVDFSIAHFLTGSPDAIGRIVAFFSVERPARPDTAIAQHDATVHLIDAKGQGRMRYSGAPLDAPRLAQDIVAIASLDLGDR